MKKLNKIQIIETSSPKHQNDRSISLKNTEYPQNASHAYANDSIDYATHVPRAENLDFQKGTSNVVRKKSKKKKKLKS